MGQLVQRETFRKKKLAQGISNVWREMRLKSTCYKDNMDYFTSKNVEILAICLEFVFIQLNYVLSLQLKKLVMLLNMPIPIRKEIPVTSCSW